MPCHLKPTELYHAMNSIAVTVTKTARARLWLAALLAIGLTTAVYGEEPDQAGHARPMMITPQSLRLALPKRVTRITTTMKPMAMRAAPTRITSTPRRKATARPAKHIKPMTTTAMPLPLVSGGKVGGEATADADHADHEGHGDQASEDAHDDHGGQFVKGDAHHRGAVSPALVQVNMTQPIQLSVDELIGGTKAQLAIKLFGADLDLLKAKGEEIAAVVRDVAGAADVQAGQVIGSPQIVVHPDREAIARHGLNLAEVQQLIEAAVGGVEAGQIYAGVQRHDIYVRYQQDARDTVEDIGHLIVQTKEGALLPLDELARIEEIVGPRQIVRENNQRYLEVQANVVGRDIGGFVEEAQAAIDAEVALPPGYLVSWGGQYELQQQANQRLAIVVPVTLALIALLLYVAFGSIKNTALILLNIPLALVGGIVGLWLAGENLSVPSSIGFIALFGIALGNGMVLLTYLNQLLREGRPIDEASIEGACLRVRPVLMTAGTTLLGLLPLLLATGTGSEVQRPLAAVVIGGLVSSTILTLLVLPALYKWFAIDPNPSI